MAPIASGIPRLAALFLLITANEASHADQFEKYRVACPPQQNKIVQGAIDQAKAALTNAVTVLPPKNSATQQKFQRWFGGKEGDYDPAVEAVYAEALGFLGFKSFWCPNASFPEDDPGTFAFVPKGPAPFGEVFVQAQFFGANTRGANSQAGTIIHEVVHLSTKKSIGDVVYGTGNASKLANTDPKKARQNADNFEYFVEDLVDGIP